MKTIVKAVISFHETGVHICVCHGGVQGLNYSVLLQIYVHKT